jgi:hypothetical protein
VLLHADVAVQWHVHATSPFASQTSRFLTAKQMPRCMLQRGSSCTTMHRAALLHNGQQHMFRTCNAAPVGCQWPPPLSACHQAAQCNTASSPCVSSSICR